MDRAFEDNAQKSYSSSFLMERLRLDGAKSIGSEVEKGNVEYKLLLSNPAPMRIAKLYVLYYLCPSPPPQKYFSAKVASG